MNKKQLIARVQRYMGPGATRNTASAAVEAVLASILDATGSPGDKLHVSRFGTFECIERAARMGYDINTAGMKEIPARKELIFKAAKDFLPQ